MSVHGASVPLPLGKRLSHDDNAGPQRWSLDYFKFCLFASLLEGGEPNPVVLYARLVVISMRITRKCNRMMSISVMDEY